jgi:nitrate reductase delta subunit
MSRHERRPEQEGNAAMKMTLRSLAVLLAYPSEEIRAHVDDIREALASERALPRAALRRLEPLMERLATDEVLEAQSAYTELFDRARSLSLHLFEHVHGDSRERGQALIDLGSQYMACGLMMKGGELPDFIPVFLEYVSCLPPGEAREALGQPVHVFAALEKRLADRGSDYAAVLGAAVALAGVRPDRNALAELDEKAPSDDPARIDQDWEETAVTFTGAHAMGGTGGLGARLRLAGKAMGNSMTGSSMTGKSIEGRSMIVTRSPASRG